VSGGGPAFAPLDYPGSLITAPTLLTPWGTHPLRWAGGALRVGGDESAGSAGLGLSGPAGGPVVGALDEVLADHAEPTLAERTPVVAVGSNGSAAVLMRKLTASGRSLWVPMVPGQIRGVAVGHSAHLSLGGYVAAAPYGSVGAVTPVVLSWFTEAQLQAMDASEPNYRRIRLAHTEYPFTSGTVQPVAFYDLYESRHGVIAVAGAVVPLGRQAELHAVLATEPELAAVAPWQQADLLGAALTRAEVRAAFARVVAERGYSRSSGLHRAHQES
jgi:hypothetical protein